MSKTKAELLKIVSKINEKKDIIAYERNSLRDIYDDLKDLIESFDSGIEALTIGCHEIESAIDYISEVV